MSRECSHMNHVSTTVTPVSAPYPSLSSRKSRNKLKKPSSPNLGKGYASPPPREPIHQHVVSFSSSQHAPRPSSVQPASPQEARSPARSPDVSTLQSYPWNSPNSYLDPKLFPSTLLPPPLPSLEEEQPPIKIKVNLYYLDPRLSARGKANAKFSDEGALSSTLEQGFVRLRDNDPIPFGVGSDESSALIVEISASLPGKPTTMVTRLIGFMKRCLVKVACIFKHSSSSSPRTKNETW
ncbi:hypothetical protein FRC02_000545 [Tulasnella sp. 418]|nr:hypothetical protein FRC02_000545 [Tulasnella sp. 418]